jgi:hypothetical protein
VSKRRRKAYQRGLADGYMEACADLTASLRDFLAGGGEVAAGLGLDRSIALRNRERTKIVSAYVLSPQTFEAAKA